MDLQLIKSPEAISIEVKQRAEEAKLIADQAGGFEIAGADGVQLAKDNIITIRKTVKDIDNIRVSITSPLDAWKKKVKALYDAPIAILNNALSTYAMKMQVFLMAEAKKAEDEARKRQAKADEIARKEQEKLEKKAEKAEEKGKPEVADALRDQKEMVVPEAPVVNSVKLPKGIYEREVWTFRIVDATKIPRDYLIPNEKMLGQVAIATKGTIIVGGIEFYSTKTIISRA